MVKSISASDQFDGYSIEVCYYLEEFEGESPPMIFKLLKLIDIESEKEFTIPLDFWEELTKLIPDILEQLDWIKYEVFPYEVFEGEDEDNEEEAATTTEKKETSTELVPPPTTIEDGLEWLGG